MKSIYNTNKFYAHFTNYCYESHKNKKYHFRGPLAFKIQRERYQCKTYCITISIQKISSDYKFTLRYGRFYSLMSLILSPVTRLATPILGHSHPKNFQSLFSMYEFVPPCKKSVNFICSFLRYSQF